MAIISMKNESNPITTPVQLSILLLLLSLRHLKIKTYNSAILSLSQKLTPAFYVTSLETYMARNKRSPEYLSHGLDLYLAERRIRQEFGPKVCIFEQPCRQHATLKLPKTHQPDWTDILR